MAKKPGTKQQDASVGQMTAQQQLFVLEYMKDLNATQAAIRAGYSSKNADKIGPALVGKSRVAAAIAVEMQKRTERVKIDADWLLQRLAEEATADIADLYDDAGQLLPVKEWPKIWRTGLVAGLETIAIKAPDDGENETVSDELEPQAHGGALKRSTKAGAYIHKIKWSDRMKRLEAIGRHINVQAFKERVSHTVEEPLAQLMREIGGSSIRPKDPAGD